MRFSKLVCAVVVGVTAVIAFSLNVKTGDIVIAESDFEVNDEGWRVHEFAVSSCIFVREELTPNHSFTGGNPGGNIYLEDPGDSRFYFMAPSKFLGDVEMAYDGYLSFDRRIDTFPKSEWTHDVILISAGTKLVYDVPAVDTTWWSQTVTLNVEAGWERCDGTPTSEAEMRSVLASLEYLLILGDMYDGYETTYLDNVILEARGILEISLDIKPRSCPNPLNITWLENLDKESGSDYALPKKGGVIPAVLVGNGDFDVTEVDISTLRLEGIEPLRTAYEDVTAPVADGDECACTVAGPDETLDLTMKFRRLLVAELVRYHERGDEVELTLTGSLLDGTQIEGSDCIIIVGKEPEPSMETGSTEVTLGPVSPNPFNPWTMIGYYLPFDCSVTIEIYDSAGRRIASLLDGEQQSKGTHAVEWSGIDDHGRPVASGVYFCRLIAGKETISRKMILLR